MSSWIWILISLVVVVLSTRGSGVLAMGRNHLNRTGRHRKPAPDQHPQTVDESTVEIRKDPNLEYQGEVYFFCSTEERDTFTANLRLGEHRPSETLKIARAIDRRA